jgi:nucleotide-binding universal stress UspA family protein
MEVRAMSLIIVGVDGSQQSRRALEWALPYAAEKSAAVHVVMAVDTRDTAEPDRAARLAQAERMVARLVAQVVATHPAPPTVTYDVVEGDPKNVLVDASQQAELMVFGSHKMSTLRNPALGTVSQACIRMGACPVLVIPAGLPEPALSGELIPA